MKTTKSLPVARRNPELNLQAIEKLLTRPAPAAPRREVIPGETYRESLYWRATAPLALNSPWPRGGLNE